MSSHPRFNKTSKMTGGNYFSNNVHQDPNEPDKNEDYYRYKAKKYHYKCQQKLRAMMADGKPCPAGYESYLRPFQG